MPANRGKFREESAWDQGGSGYSAYFSQPSYQNGVGARLGSMNARVTPDISAIANPNTPVWVLCTACTNGGWYGVGGTSAAAPLMAFRRVSPAIRAACRARVAAAEAAIGLAILVTLFRNRRTIDVADIDKADAWFTRHGPKAVFFGRFLPTIRTLISVPAGLSRMPSLPFLIYSGIGSLIWTAALTLAGYLLEGGYEQVEHLLNPVSTAIVIGLVAVYVWRVVTFDPSR